MIPYGHLGAEEIVLGGDVVVVAALDGKGFVLVLHSSLKAIINRSKDNEQIWDFI